MLTESAAKLSSPQISEAPHRHEVGRLCFQMLGMNASGRMAGPAFSEYAKLCGNSSFACVLAELFSELGRRR